MQSDKLTYDFMMEQKVNHVNLSAAGIGPAKLKSMGLPSVADLRKIGFDALYLADNKFLSEAVAEFGSDEIISTYLVSASDAVAISGSDAVETLGISTTKLLQECAGASQEAFAVLQQLPRDALKGVPPSVVLDTGLRKKALGELGYSLTAVTAQTGASACDLRKLGF
jgi:hypothetical protein